MTGNSTIHFATFTSKEGIEERWLFSQKCLINGEKYIFLKDTFPHIRVSWGNSSYNLAGAFGLREEEGPWEPGKVNTQYFKETLVRIKSVLNDFLLQIKKKKW